MLDVGSNTVHLLVVDAHHGGAPVPAHSHKIELKLSEFLNDDGKIAQKAIDLLCDFVLSALVVAEDLGVTEIMAFATSAIRDAGNTDKVINEVFKRTGVRLQVLSGQDEARLTFLAVRRWFGWSAGRIMAFDIGGGSLELASGLDEDPDIAVSIPLGAGRLTRDHFTADPPPEEEVRALRKMIRAELGNVAGMLTRLGQPEVTVATSKTFRQLARVAGAAPSSEGFYVRRSLRRDDLSEWIPKLASMAAEERAQLPGVSPGRSKQLLAGALVAESAMAIMDATELLICPWALREGIILRKLDGLPE